MGVTIDDELNWGKHIENITKKANFAMHQSRNMLGKRVGLSPKVCKFIYEGIIRPLVSYAAVVWIGALELAKNKVV